MGYVKQNLIEDVSSFPASVYEIVSSNLYKKNGFLGLINTKQKLEIYSLLKEFELLELKDKLVSKLSGGQIQKVMLIRALINEPGFLILDEPTASLDKESTTDFFKLLYKINKDMKVTILMVTHDLENAKIYSSRTLKMDNKTITEEKENAN